MKKVRKGFTLVELLIVIAIIGALSATMSVAVSGSTAKAKAATIASNVNACKSAATLYMLSADVDLSKKTADDMLNESIPTWIDFSSAATDDNKKNKGTTYTAEGTGSDNWAVVVDFGNEPDREAVRTELQKIKGYGRTNSALNSKNEPASVFGVSTPTYSFKVTLLSGKISPVTTNN